MDIEKHIDYTLLKPKVSDNDLNIFLETAKNKKYRGICTFSQYIDRMSEKLNKNKELMKISIVRGFPFGVNDFKSKLNIKNDIINEIDIVPNLNNLFSPDLEIEFQNIRYFYKNFIVKIIIETEILNEKEIKYMCEMCNKYNIDFIKTCTGFNGKLSDNKLEIVLKYKGNCMVKASGGINTRDRAVKLINMGVDVIGASTIL